MPRAALSAGPLVALAAAGAMIPSLVLASEEGSEGGNPLTRFQPGVLIWTIITFVLLVILLRWKAWPRIVEALQLREQAVRGAIEEARRGREEAARLIEEHRRMIEQARRETAAMIEQGRKDAEAVRGELIAKARQDASEVIDQGRRQIERDTRAAALKLRGEAANLAVLAAGRIVKVSLDETAQRRLVEECLNEIADHPKN